MRLQYALVLGILLTAVEKGNSLRCYHCVTFFGDRDEPCNFTQTVDCPYDKYCMRAEHRLLLFGQKSYTYVRGCGDRNFCREVRPHFGIDLECYTCNTDLCNYWASPHRNACWKAAPCLFPFITLFALVGFHF